MLLPSLPTGSAIEMDEDNDQSYDEFDDLASDRSYERPSQNTGIPLMNVETSLKVSDVKASTTNFVYGVNVVQNKHINEPPKNETSLGIYGTTKDKEEYFKMEGSILSEGLALWKLLCILQMTIMKQVYCVAIEL